MGVMSRAQVPTLSEPFAKAGLAVKARQNNAAKGSSRQARLTKCESCKCIGEPSSYAYEPRTTKPSADG